MLLLTVIVTFCAVWASPPNPSRSPRLYYVSVLLIAAGALGAFCSTDLFFFYAFHELALVPTFLMIGIWGSGDNKAAAWKVTIYLGLGSVILLIGLAGLVLAIQPQGVMSFNIPDLLAEAKANPAGADAQKWIFLFLLLGFGVLISLFPFHSWAPQAYASAPVPVAMLHAGVLKKFGLYGLLRVALPMMPDGFEAWKGLLIVLLLGNILFIGFATISQRFLDRMLGYSSVMHMGYVFLGIAAFNEIGWQGAVLLMFAHGVSIALLFLLCGKLRDSLGTLEFAKMGGLGAAAPAMMLAFGFAAFASVGLPGFANFASELMVFFAAFKGFDAQNGLGDLQWAAILALWGVVISAVYMLRAFRRIFQGEPCAEEEAAPVTGAADLTGLLRVPVIILIAALMVFGFFPKLLTALTHFSF
ncbi:MAG: NADH-quinone oxidoreductase subunit M [Verrucomicrobiales bacterium]